MATWRSSKEILVDSPRMALRKTAPAPGGEAASKAVSVRCEHGGGTISDVNNNDNSSIRNGMREDRVTSHDRDKIVSPPTLPLPGTKSGDGVPARAAPSPTVGDEPLLLPSSSPLARPALAVSGGGPGSATPVTKNGGRYLSLSTMAAAAAIAHDSRNISIGWSGGRHRLNGGSAAVSTGGSSEVPALSPSTSGPHPPVYPLPPLIQSQPAGNAWGSVGSLMFPLPLAAGGAKTMCTPAAAASIAAFNNMYNIRWDHNSYSRSALRSLFLLVPGQVGRARKSSRTAETEKERTVPHYGLQRQKHRDAGSGGGLPMFGEEGATILQETDEEDVYPLYHRKPDAGPTEVEAVVAADPTAGRGLKRGGGDHSRPDGMPMHGRSVLDSSGKLGCDSTASVTHDRSTTDQAGAKAAKVPALKMCIFPGCSVRPRLGSQGTILPLLCFQHKRKRTPSKDPGFPLTSPGREASDGKKPKKQKRMEKDKVDNGSVPAVAPTAAVSASPPQADGWAPGE